MTDFNPEVAALVEKELKKDPTLTSAELKERAIEIDGSVETLSGRQFHAQYALQVRKRLSHGKPKKRRKQSRRSGPKDADKGDVRSLLAGGYEERKAALDDAIADAFERALDADSFARVNQLFSQLERHRKDFESV